MKSIKEEYLEVLAELQEQGKIPHLTPEEQRILELRMDTRIEKLKRVTRDGRLSNTDWAYKFGGYLLAMDRKEPRTAALALKRFWRRRALEQRRWDRQRRKRFR